MNKLSIFPISLKVADGTVLIVGGADEAVNKARLLAKSKARIRVVAPEVCDELQALAHEVELREIVAEDFDGVRAVFVATEDNDERDRAISYARARHILLNVVDQPEYCDFYTPAIVDRAPISVAISSEGEAPVLARLVRAQIEALLSPKLGQLARLGGALRDRVADLIADGVGRRRFYENLLTSQKVISALEESEPKARRAALRLLDQHASKASATRSDGIVWLIGAGPGAEDLLTLRAQRLLQEADVIVYDQLVPDLVVQMGRRDAQRISVGKAKGSHSIKQHEINGLLVDLAGQGLKVARLKSGDPMVFGRAHEEIEALETADIAFSIVPGVTAGLAAAADTQLPVTLRDVSPGVVFATAHGAGDGELDHWAALANSGMTLGIYMSKSVLARTASKLLARGVNEDLPVAIVINAGRENAASFAGTLANLPGPVDLPAGPALLFAGDAVAYGHFDKKIQIVGEGLATFGAKAEQVA